MLDRCDKGVNKLWWIGWELFKNRSFMYKSRVVCVEVWLDLSIDSNILERVLVVVICVKVEGSCLKVWSSLVKFVNVVLDCKLVDIIEFCSLVRELVWREMVCLVYCLCCWLVFYWIVILLFVNKEVCCY